MPEKAAGIVREIKRKTELDTVAIRIVGTSHTSRILFLFRRERS